MTAIPPLILVIDDEPLTVAMAMTAHSPWRGLPDMTVGIRHALAPYCYRCPFKLKPESCGAACADDVEELIRTTTTGRPSQNQWERGSMGKRSC